MTLVLRTAARSDVGLVRPGNEDSGYAGPDLVVVADGMGGHAAGELASAVAVATLAELETEGLADEDAVARLSGAVEQTSERIADVISAQPELAGMGTTVTALAWLGAPGRVALVHVGDSRAYLLRDGELAQLTRDHTYVQSLVDAGRITLADAAIHPRRSLLMRAIDGVHEAEPDISVREARVGDRFLLCSDGLSGVLPDVRLLSLLQVTDSTAAVTALVDAALAGGAPDNVTCVVADVVDVDEETARPPQAAVVVGAAGEPRTRERLPELNFPVDAQLDPDSRRATTGSGAALVRVNTAPDTHLEGPEALARVYFEEQRAPRRHRRAVIASVVAVIAVLAAIAVALGIWASGQWYVGESEGRVAVFQGVPGSVGPISLHRVETLTDLSVDQLPTFEAEQVVDTIYASSQSAAAATVVRLQVRAQSCITSPSVAGCPGAPT